MQHRSFTRRQFLAVSTAAGGLAVLPRITLAAETLVAATFGGTWSEVHRKLLAPYFRERTGANVTQAVMLATEQIAKLTAAKGGLPPFDVAILDEGPALNAINADLIQEYDVSKSPNFEKLLPPFQDKWGPAVTMQCIGLAYNPNTVKTPSTSWDDLWDPQYKGRVGITSLASTLGTAFLVDIARLNGGSESDIEPAFEKLRTLLPNVGAVSANFGAHAALFQQEEVDIGVQNFNFVQTLKAKGVSIEFVRPASGTPGWKTTMHVVAGAENPDLATTYVDSHLAADLQEKMQLEPYNVIPTNGDVSLGGLVAERIAKTPEELNDFVFFDWAQINEGRPEWTERFNKEIRI